MSLICFNKAILDSNEATLTPVFDVILLTILSVVKHALFTPRRNAFIPSKLPQRQDELVALIIPMADCRIESLDTRTVF